MNLKKQFFVLSIITLAFNCNSSFGANPQDGAVDAIARYVTNSDGPTALSRIQLAQQQAVAEEQKKLAALIARKPERTSALLAAGEMFIGRTPTAWTLEELSAAARADLKGRNFDNGRKMFGAAGCFACHRFGNEGGMTGPDLTTAGGRYSARDFLDNVINPSKEINEQFAPIVVKMSNGKRYEGVVVNLHGETMELNTDLSDPAQRVIIDRKFVASIETSKVSPMPEGLLNLLTKSEVMDLIAYVLSGGDRNSDMFKP